MAVQVAGRLEFMRQMLDRIRYFNWRFRVDMDAESVYLYVEWGSLPDAYNIEQRVGISARYRAPLEGLPPELFVLWVFECVKTLHAHEAAEWFFVDDERPFDEHLRPGVYDPLAPYHALMRSRQ